MTGRASVPRPERPNHVWSYDFVHDRSDDGRVYCTLDIIDDVQREALAIRVDRKLNSIDVVDAPRAETVYPITLNQDHSVGADQ